MLYVKRKAKTPIGSESVRKVLSRHDLGDDFTRTAESYTNDTFRVNAPQTSYYLKFFTDQWCDPEAGKRELSAIRLLRENGIPTPELLAFEYADREVSRNYAIFKALPGHTISTDTSAFNLAHVQQVQALLTRMGAIQGPLGFVGHDPKVHSTYGSHFEFINDSVFYAFKKLSDFGYDVQGLSESLSKWQHKGEPNHIGFCHCDFTPKHILVDSEDITGLIDFEWAIFADPTMDTALFMTSLAEYGFGKEYIEPILQEAKTADLDGTLHYHLARILIMGAAWPHKNVEQPFFSQSCLNKAKVILSRQQAHIEDLLWEGPMVKEK
ncbi:MAG: phosphotransferase [Nanoarchaeota archaeon]